MKLGGVGAGTVHSAVESRRRHLYFQADIVTVAQVAIDGAGSSLASRDSADYRSRAGDAFASGEQAGVFGNSGMAVGIQQSTDGWHPGADEVASIAGLANGHQHYLGIQAELLGRSRLVHCPAVYDLRDYLRLDHQPSGLAVFGSHTYRSLQVQNLAALGDGRVDFLGLGGHVHCPAAVGHLHGGRVQAQGGTGDIHGDVAAANHHYPLALEAWHQAVADFAKHLHGGEHTFGILALDAQLLVLMRPYGHEHRIEVLAQLVQ